MGAETLRLDHRRRRGRGRAPAGPAARVRRSPFDATGAPAAVRAMVDMAASAGRAVQVGMSVHDVPLRIGSFTEKELDVLGVSCCGAGEFAEAVASWSETATLIGRLISHEFPLEQAPEALRLRDGDPYRRDEGRDPR